MPRGAVVVAESHVVSAIVEQAITHLFSFVLLQRPRFVAAPKFCCPVEHDHAQSGRLIAQRFGAFHVHFAHGHGCAESLGSLLTRTAVSDQASVITGASRAVSASVRDSTVYASVCAFSCLLSYLHDYRR